MEWGPWSACSEGARTREEVVTREPNEAGRQCEEPRQELEPCIDCEILEWSEWSECSAGVRSRSPAAVRQAMGGGRPCPSLDPVLEVCIDCETRWSEWSECAGGLRTRELEIVQDRIGAGAECPPPETETQGGCRAFRLCFLTFFRPLGQGVENGDTECGASTRMAT